jgi:hypothetical protein
MIIPVREHQARARASPVLLVELFVERQSTRSLENGAQCPPPRVPFRSLAPDGGPDTPVEAVDNDRAVVRRGPQIGNRARSIPASLRRLDLDRTSQIISERRDHPPGEGWARAGIGR